MPTAKKIIPKETDYPRAAWYAFRKPRSAWVHEAACGSAPPDELPDGSRTPQEVTDRFIAKYCGSCTVPVECVLAEVGKEVVASGSVHGGLKPPDARRIITAIGEIEAHGTLENAAQQLGRDLTLQEPPRWQQGQHVPPQVEHPE